ncbi:acyltransferase family protein [Pseudobutyrivibrio xylanivorans]|uniref:Peptidoglycan/LPS O-acetylase OafA/YrhL, contains acyltransferase and SGNH-hydrolase domains n=1 Tax=Pseudobutyrivibrio xylanivorans TaxID=185007 RepID=A0A1G5RWY6_PSEXY|nr:acyltransferase [Pseudobutyrivibrio xylanivorans]SCZ78635.1 Peptidoglycan/LPS O-acetylase OafA/YrhL, contains acyltransferase and SGNH-hydrolase domains [Pseudobutyrivibrio xylanivorans]
MDNWISRNNSSIVRGLAALVIMYVHLGYTVPKEDNLLYLFEPLGYLCVGIFFFYTGYNLIATVEKKGTKGFVLSKIKRIYIPFVIANIIYILYLLSNGEYNYSTRGLLYSIVGLRLPNDTLWYVVSILWYQVLFFILYKIYEVLSKNKNNNTVALLMIIIAFVLYTISYPKVANITGAIQGYTEVFPISIIAGAIVRCYEEKIFKFVKSYKFQLMFALLFSLAFCFSKNSNGIRMMVMNIDIYNVLAPLLAALLVNVIICGEELKGKYSLLLGAISYEIYILHKPVMMFLRGNIICIENTIIYLIVYTLVLWGCAYILCKINKLGRIVGVNGEKQG